MNREIKIKVPINPNKLIDIMHSKGESMTSIEKDGVYSAKTIQRGLKAEKMTPELVSYLSYYLGISPTCFADVDKYLNELKKFIFNWEAYKE